MFNCSRDLVCDFALFLVGMPNRYEKALRGAVDVLAGPIVIIYCKSGYMTLKRENSIVMGIYTHKPVQCLKKAVYSQWVS